MRECVGGWVGGFGLCGWVCVCELPSALICSVSLWPQSARALVCMSALCTFSSHVCLHYYNISVPYRQMYILNVLYGDIEASCFKLNKVEFMSPTTMWAIFCRFHQNQQSNLKTPNLSSPVTMVKRHSKGKCHMQHHNIGESRTVRAVNNERSSGSATLVASLHWGFCCVALFYTLYSRFSLPIYIIQPYKEKIPSNKCLLSYKNVH